MTSKTKILKLYRCDVVDDCDSETIILVARSEEEAKQRIENMDWSCLMHIFICEINDIDGYKIMIK